MADEDEKNVEGDLDPDAEGEEGEEGDEKKSGKLKLILIIVVPILLIGGGGAAYFTGMLDSLLGVEAVEDGGEHGGEEGGQGEAAGGHGGGGEEGGGASAFLPIPPMLVNLNSEEGVPRFLRLTVHLELAHPSDSDKVQAVLPRVVDQFQTYLRELRVKDLRGSAGIYRLQIELLWRVNQAVEPIEIKDVLFQEILIQ